MSEILRKKSLVEFEERREKKGGMRYYMLSYVYDIIKLINY